MARVTVEDCIDKVSNRFELVMLACHRVRAISTQSPITVGPDNDKNSVIALREIAEETISTGDLKEDLIQSLQQFVEVDEPEPEAAPLLVPDFHTSILDPDDRSKDTVIDRMTEDELLHGLKNLATPKFEWIGSHKSRRQS